MRPRPFCYKMTAALAVLVGALALTACASSQSSSQPAGAGNATAAAAAGSAPAASGSAQAASGGTTVSSALKARVQALLSSPTGIGRTTPLTRTPAAGKLIVGIETPIGTALVTGAGQAAGARLLGWRYHTIQEGTGPEDPEQALNLAIALKPSGIIYYTAPRQSMAAGLAKAKAAGIPIVTSATADANPPTAPIIAQYNNSAAMLAPLGAGLADYVAVNSNLSAHVALVTLPVYSVLQSWAALPLESMGYGLIDSFARYFNGQSLNPIVTEPPSWQILTRSNIASAHLDGEDNYIGYSDYAAAWAKLWKVK